MATRNYRAESLDPRLWSPRAFQRLLALRSSIATDLVMLYRQASAAGMPNTCDVHAATFKFHKGPEIHDHSLRGRAGQEPFAQVEDLVNGLEGQLSELDQMLRAEARWLHSRFRALQSKLRQSRKQALGRRGLPRYEDWRFWLSIRDPRGGPLQLIWQTGDGPLAMGLGPDHRWKGLCSAVPPYLLPMVTQVEVRAALVRYWWACLCQARREVSRVRRVATRSVPIPEQPNIRPAERMGTSVSSAVPSDPRRLSWLRSRAAALLSWLRGVFRRRT